MDKHSSVLTPIYRNPDFVLLIALIMAKYLSSVLYNRRRQQWHLLSRPILKLQIYTHVLKVTSSNLCAVLLLYTSCIATENLQQIMFVSSRVNHCSFVAFLNINKSNSLKFNAIKNRKQHKLKQFQKKKIKGKTKQSQKKTPWYFLSHTLPS